VHTAAMFCHLATTNASHCITYICVTPCAAVLLTPPPPDLLWACASLNLQPSPPFLKSLLTTAARAADAGRFSVQQLGTLVWSLAVIKPPSQALLMSQQLQVQVLLQAVAAARNGQGLRLLGPGGWTGGLLGVWGGGLLMPLGGGGCLLEGGCCCHFLREGGLGNGLLMPL
jgi:hypothetical protein